MKRISKEIDFSTIIIIVLSVLVILGIFGIISVTRYYNNHDIQQAYWDEMALKSYIIHFKTNISSSGGGNGWLYYSKEGKDYVIHCQEIFLSGHTMQDTCKEGEVSWGEKYNPDTIKWINVTFER